ncbi:hypothetical protein D1816_17990 [Aquimarina sp. AD10]|uniref:Uncharacterized protein n=1 Tax=Aquimarina aggregata TaxID=1642818 RepID=A0A162F9H0_9FLAO|nr:MULTISPECIES: hypothetical protein [Aquimarina]AXT62168.1 hypothetical protein D1816_17990 [Aquimarina sp. AD10]KZS39856.1 hypothetical protein AWE51_09430 [Aquimarina aggregata]RKM90637.1 hypothetical protein D7033_24390 [Aquimarina sp. AD10]
MKNYDPKTKENDLTQGEIENEFLLQEIRDPELKDVISDVISYSEDYEIYIDNDDMMDWI